MAKYRVKVGMKGYINDRMEFGDAEPPANVFEAKAGLKALWFDPVADEAPAEVSESDSGEVQTAAAMEDAASEDQATRPDPALAEAEIAASENKDVGVETL